MAEASSLYFANDIFDPSVIQGIYDVIQPEAGALKIQSAFFPDESYTTDEAILYFQHQFWGMTPPTALGADPMPIGIPGGFYRGYEFGYWGEYSRFESKDLLQVKNPASPYKADGVTPNLWGEDMMRNAMAHQKQRFTTFKEAFCGALISAGNFHYFGDGIDNYYPGPSSTDYILDSHYRLDCSSAGTVTHGGWTTGGDWSVAASANPIKDINEMIEYLAVKLGLQVTEIWMSTKVAKYLVEADQTTSWIEKNPELSRSMLAAQTAAVTLNKIVGGNVKFVVEDRTYPERMVVKTPTVASVSTTCNIRDDAAFRGATSATVMFHTRDGKERLVAVTIASNTLTFTAADLDISMSPGDFVIYHKRYMDEDKLIFKTDKSDRMRFASLPCQTSPEDALSPGVHTYSQEFVKKPNWAIVAGTYFRGGPAVFSNGGWATLKVY